MVQCVAAHNKSPGGERRRFLVAQYVAVCCSVLQCVAMCRGVLQCVAVCCGVLRCVATRTKSQAERRGDLVCCSVLQRGRVLQRVAMCCSVYQHARSLKLRAEAILYVVVCVWPCVAVCCSVSQCVTTRTKSQAASWEDLA